MQKKVINYKTSDKNHITVLHKSKMYVQKILPNIVAIYEAKFSENIKIVNSKIKKSLPPHLCELHWALLKVSCLKSKIFVTKLFSSQIEE